MYSEEYSEELHKMDGKHKSNSKPKSLIASKIIKKLTPVSSFQIT